MACWEVKCENLPCKQRFLSCMAFSIDNIIRMACLSVNKPTVQQVSQANDFFKPCKREASACRVVKMKINLLDKRGKLYMNGMVI